MTAEKRAYYATRTTFAPEPGKWYENEGGGRYKCLKSCYGVDDDLARMQSKNGWTFVAHGVGVYADGRIDWDYSTGGHFEEVMA